MANQQGALSDPKATCDPGRPCQGGIVDIEYELLDTESDIVDVAATLAAERTQSGRIGPALPFAAGSVVRVESCE